MSSLKKKIMLIDLVCLAVSTFFFLYIAPSVEVRQRLVCVIVFNLIEAIVCRLCFQAGFALKEDDRKILDAVAKSGKTVDEVLELLEK